MPKHDDEYLTRCVIDPLNRSFNLYSNNGSHKQIMCDTLDEFMNVLSYIKESHEDNLVGGELVYVDPLSV
jgi:hypothetical protein